MAKQTSSKTKEAEKEKVLSVPTMAMRSFMGKNPSGKKEEKPGLFDNLKSKKNGKKK